MYPCKSKFYNIKVGCKGVYITRTCKHGEIDWIYTTQVGLIQKQLKNKRKSITRNRYSQHILIVICAF